MLDTDLRTRELADRLDQLAAELSMPLDTASATERANDQTVAALLLATAPQLAQEAAVELRRLRVEVESLKAQVSRNERAEHRVDAVSRSRALLAQQLEAAREAFTASLAEGSVLDVQIQNLPFSVRCHNVLAREGVHTLGQLLALSESNLLGMVNLGQRSVFEIKQMLDAIGLRLRLPKS